MVDIRKQTKDKDSSPKESLPKKNASKQETQFKTGIVQQADAKLMIPPAIQLKLSAIGQKYGLPFDLSNISLDGKMADNVKALRKIVEMVEGDSQLLPEMAKLIKRLLKADIKLAQFHKLLTKQAIKHQQKIDKQTADIFLMMSGFQAKSEKLELKTNRRAELKQKRSQAYQDYYNNSVFGAESALIDVEFEVLADNQKVLTDAKTKQLQFNAESKKRVSEYVQSAFE